MDNGHCVRPRSKLRLELANLSPLMNSSLGASPPKTETLAQGRGNNAAYELAPPANKELANSGSSGQNTLRFWRNERVQCLHSVHPSRTLLQLLREELHTKGTKEGCGEGDCGACTVVIAELEHGEIQFRAINSCIRLAHSVNALSLWSVEDLVAKDGALHPAQRAMLDAHATQCGFCSPGFVMSLFAMYQNYVAKGLSIDRHTAQTLLSGNLCRCTGYRPILDAAERMSQYPCPPTLRVNTQALKQQLESLARLTQAEESLERLRGQSKKMSKRDKAAKQPIDTAQPSGTSDQGGPANSSLPDQPYYWSPRSLEALLTLKAAHPQAQLIAGTTDLGLSITKQFKVFDHIIDLTRVSALSNTEEYPHHIAIGAGAKLTEAFEALVKDRPQLQTFSERFAGLPIRNSATLGGNIANGSPVGDSMPLLLCLGSSLVLMHMQRGRIHHREVLLEDFYTGYRTNILKPNEIIAWIKVPKPHSNEISHAFKISKRFDDDISAVCLALSMSVSNGRIAFARIGVGGVAPTPVVAHATQQALVGQPFLMRTFLEAQSVLAAEFKPLSDLRASAAYRIQLLKNLLYRFALLCLDAGGTQRSPFWIDLSSARASDILWTTRSSSEP